MPTIYNKVVIDGTTLMDISDTTATASDVASGKYFYTTGGVKTEGTATSGGGTTPTLITKEIITNGTYTASNDSADGYSSVTVNVPTGITPTGTKEVSISANGVTTEDVTNYASARITVNVSGGGTPSATMHTLYFEFEDGTNQTVYVYYDDAFIGSAITATRPTTKNNKTVTLAQLDGVTWYSYDPTAIPLNTQLIDYSKCEANKAISQDGEVIEQEWYYASDYAKVDHSMTFSYIAGIWTYIAFYDSSKTFISSINVYNDGTVDPDDGNLATGTLTPSKIPSNAAYVRMSSVWYDDENLSLIRTA